LTRTRPIKEERGTFVLQRESNLSNWAFECLEMLTQEGGKKTGLAQIRKKECGGRMWKPHTLINRVFVLNIRRRMKWRLKEEKKRNWRKESFKATRCGYAGGS